MGCRVGEGVADGGVMKIARSVEELRVMLAPARGEIVLVPTMGALHEGHLSLVARAREAAGANGMVVVSIFVNPIQFDRASDLESYPRTLVSDVAKCAAAGVDVVYAPTAAAMYHSDRSTMVTESLLSATLCGAARPGHFDGVCTVVLKLFLQSGCKAAVFGEKDFQQLAVIRRMVRDLDVPVEIVECPTMREADGLAMSSRNVRLSREARADAPHIYQAMQAAANALSVPVMLAEARERIEASGLAKVDYVELVDAETMQAVDDFQKPAILAAAVFYGEVRLIDHLAVPARGSCEK